jgi:hypothetical protein
VRVLQHLHAEQTSSVKHSPAVSSEVSR